MSDSPGYPSYESSPLPARNSTMATVSLILGIASWVILPVIGGIAAVITGHMARKEIREGMGQLTGDGLATAGLVLGYLNLGLSLCALCGIALYVAGILGTMGLSSTSSSLLLGLP